MENEIISGKYIHVGCDKDNAICKILQNCGFNLSVHTLDNDKPQIYKSIHNAEMVIIFESSDTVLGNQSLAYQIGEGLATGKEVILVSPREYTGFSEKYENTEGITIIRGTKECEIFHLLLVEKLCRMPEFYDDTKCVRDRHGDVVHHAVDAWRGVPASEKFLGECYMHGEILPKLYKNAVFWFVRATEHGSIRSRVLLGDCYFNGLGCPENKKKAYELYCDACTQSSPDGYFKKGFCLYSGEGCECDYTEAVYCFGRALELRRGYPEAEYYLGLCNLYGLGTQENYGDAKSRFLKSAKGNYTPALIALGNLYSESEGDDRNPALAYEYYSRAAANRDTFALYKKGLALSVGDGCEKNPDLAFECFKAGADEGNLNCMCSLGMCYEFGVGCDIDYVRACECYKISSDGKNACALNNLGGCYFYGHGVARDLKIALELFEKAAALGDANAMARMGICYEDGIYYEKDVQKAFELYRKAAAQSNVTGLYRAALCHEKGMGTATDMRAAFACYEKAAGLGHIPSMYAAANYLSDGIGTKKDLWKAYKWYTKGALGDNAECALQVAHFSFRGMGTVKNYTRAFEFYNKAYELGLQNDDIEADTALRIGVCQLRGLGVKEDRQRALEWFKKSCAMGNPDAMFLCGESYYYGSGCARDYSLAVRYYANAINSGHVRAIIELAGCYERGYGVKQDIKRAMELYRRAAKHESPEAYFKIAELMHAYGKEYVSARPLLFKAANMGYIPASLMLGVLYDKGLGIDVNLVKASERYSEAIAKKEKSKGSLFSMPERNDEKNKVIADASVEATYRMGILLGKTAKDADGYKNSFKYLAAASAMGSEEAQKEVAKIFLCGGDVAKYFKQSQETPDPMPKQIADAMNKLGDTWYEGGEFFEKDERVAVKCYKISAQMGNSDACYSLGWCLRHGVGTHVDDAEAARWLKKSADKGNAYAAYSYGLCCEEGSGMDRPNLREAVTYYRKAALAGHVDAKKRHIKLVGGGNKK